MKATKELQRLFQKRLIFSWHRLALSIKGDSVTLLVDCQVRDTQPLRRKPGSTFNLAGVLVVGAQISPDQYYDVSIPT